MAKREERWLWCSALASGAAVICSTAAVVIALLAWASPPVSKYLSAEQNAAVAARMNWQWTLPVFVLVLALWAGVQIVLRRPVLFSSETLARHRVTRSGVCVFAVLVAMLGVFTATNVYSAARLALETAPAPMTDSSSFSGIGLSLASFAIALGSLSFTTFQLWWQESQPWVRMRVSDEAAAA